MAVPKQPILISCRRTGRPSCGSGTRLLSVSCGTLCAQFDVDLFKSQSALGKKNIKCVQVAGSDWVLTPDRFESMGGKGSVVYWTVLYT